MAKAEGTHPGLVKAEIIQDLSRSLARAATRAIARRTLRVEMVTRHERILVEATMMQDDAETEAMEEAEMDISSILVLSLCRLQP